MTAQRREQVRAIFDRVVECDPAARAENLRQWCGSDQELRQEVESLLASDTQAVSSILRIPGLNSGGMAAAAAAEKSEASQVLKARYEMERELGRGGMSVVYLARDRQLLGKRVVVKVLLEETSQDAWMRQKFLQEMEALARIDHPGVVGVLDTGLTPEGRQFLVMQFIEGVTLRSVIQPGGMEFMRAARILRQIGQALAAAHAKGVWHRDLKPENVMLQRLGGEDHVTLIDFGIAGIQNSQFRGEKTKVAGTLSYMAPEQFAGHACAASDTYALAVVARELLNGVLPTSSTGLTRELPDAAERSIRKAMALQPEARQTSVLEFSEELYQALTGEETARKPTLPGTVEIAHVLFTDLVGYSLLPMDQQKDYLRQLQQIVRESLRFRAAETAGDIISLPTGDGMALAFFGDPTAPVQCAVEVCAALKSQPHLKLRMGIHSGPVYRVADVNANANVAGGGINMAQRVMDCGDAGHILVSKTVADVLLQLSQWAPYLTDLGACTVKHGVTVHICNLVTEDVGNRERPRKLRASTILKTKSKVPLALVMALVVAVVVAGAFWIGRGGKSSPAAQDKASIAVLPFVDMSANKDQEYFSTGLAEELLNTLTKIPRLRVAARTSSFQFVGKAEDFRVIGQKLNVATILEGSVRKQNNRARIGVQLIKASDGIYIWSDTYDTEMNDIFAVQEKIARAVTGALEVTLMGAGTAAASTRVTNPEAYKAYLQGRYFCEQGSQENLDKAVGYLDSATRLDPSYAPAWVQLGVCRALQAGGAYVAAEEAYSKARQAVQRALAIDRDLGEAHAALGFIEMYQDWNWAGASASFRRARALAPGDAGSIKNEGSLARFEGRFDEAIALDQRAIEIDPLYSNAYKNFGIILYDSGRQEQAKAAFAKALELAPQIPFVHGYLSQVALAQSNPREALAQAQRETHPGFRLQGLALAYHALGNSQESNANLTKLIAQFQKDAPYVIGEVYAFRGELDQAFQWLERAYTDHDGGLTEIKGDPLLKSLRRDPRYTALLKKMHLPL